MQEEGVIHEVSQVGDGWDRVAVEAYHDDLVDESAQRAQWLEFSSLI